MALLAIEIDRVAKRPGEPETFAGSMRELRERTAEISTEIRNLSHQLHSSKLEVLGLVEAVRGHCQEIQAQSVNVRFHDDNVPRSLPHDVELCLFRIVQEALNNVVRHSGAREAEVTLRANGDVLVLSVADLGRGFDERERGGSGRVGAGQHARAPAAHRWRAHRPLRARSGHHDHRARAHPGSGARRPSPQSAWRRSLGQSFTLSSSGQRAS